MATLNLITTKREKLEPNTLVHLNTLHEVDEVSSREVKQSKNELYHLKIIDSTDNHFNPIYSLKQKSKQKAQVRKQHSKLSKKSQMSQFLQNRAR